MNFVITQIFTHLSTSTYGSPSQKLPTPPTSSGASPANVAATLRLEIADLRAQLASKEREIQQLRQSKTVQSVGLVGYAKDSADFILSQQRQDAMNYAKQPVVKTKMVGQLFLSHKFLSSLVSWMIHSAMMHTLFHSYASPTPRQTFTFPRQMVHMPTALVASPKIGVRLLAWQHYLKGAFALPSKLRKILA